MCCVQNRCSVTGSGVLDTTMDAFFLKTTIVLTHHLLHPTLPNHIVEAKTLQVVVVDRGAAVVCGHCGWYLVEEVLALTRAWRCNIDSSYLLGVKGVSVYVLSVLCVVLFLVHLQVLVWYSPR